MVVPLGFRFAPKDQELILDYLFNKATGKPLPCNGVVNECDLYRCGEKDLSKLFERSNENVLYFFTKLKKKDNGKRIGRTTGTGTWKGQDSGHPIYKNKTLIGVKKSFVYMNKSKPCGWIMKEFSLDGFTLERAQIKDYVICRVKNKQKQNNLVEENNFQQEEPNMIIVPQIFSGHEILNSNFQSDQVNPIVNDQPTEVQSGEIQDMMTELQSVPCDVILNVPNMPYNTDINYCGNIEEMGWSPNEMCDLDMLLEILSEPSDQLCYGDDQNLDSNMPCVETSIGGPTKSSLAVVRFEDGVGAPDHQMAICPSDCECERCVYWKENFA